MVSWKLGKEHALALVLDVVKEKNLCENIRSRINYDVGLYFTLSTHISLEQLSLILLGHIHRSQMSPTEIDSILKRGADRLLRSK